MTDRLVSEILVHTPASSSTSHPGSAGSPAAVQPDDNTAASSDTANAAPTSAAPAAMAAFGASVDHYENFPVASWLCPAPLRPAVAAIYRFARLADDMADEGEHSAGERLAELAAYRAELDAALQGHHPARWPQVFGPLTQAVQRHALDPALLHALLSAFEQDVRHTDSGHRYADLPELLDYCARSANPIGRLLLQLWNVRHDEALERSDRICSALQLINFWQDLSRDLPRGRIYLPANVLRRHGAAVEDFLPGATTRDRERNAVVAELCAHARGLMQMGAPLVHEVGGRAGWELRLVVQGGLRVLDRIAAIEHRSWQERVTVDKADLPLLVWRALWM
jgi:hydroxysqualene synthase